MFVGRRELTPSGHVPVLSQTDGATAAHLCCEQVWLFCPLPHFSFPAMHAESIENAREPRLLLFLVNRGTLL
jgi:hypothetical protein